MLFYAAAAAAFVYTSFQLRLILRDTPPLSLRRLLIRHDITLISFRQPFDFAIFTYMPLRLAFVAAFAAMPAVFRAITL